MTKHGKEWLVISLCAATGIAMKTKAIIELVSAKEAAALIGVSVR